ncbi:hypothetical protein GE061_006662 [Apolygus lucorum]|uniref:Reverse transcriptase domain-containing protein n=1 Tax=Apolygus lucorum TaxID=248454 RepID=A0A8S9WVV2_APOLU|nr:hypothetical protein GE061_006662 [Apolygus lucorum]
MESMCDAGLLRTNYHHQPRGRMRGELLDVVVLLLLSYLAHAQTKGLHSYQINPKPCRVNELEGKCMFVWECINSGGTHIGMCVDAFMFGTCCGHNLTQAEVSRVPSGGEGGPAVLFTPPLHSSKRPPQLSRPSDHHQPSTRPPFVTRPHSSSSHNYDKWTKPFSTTSAPMESIEGNQIDSSWNNGIFITKPSSGRPTGRPTKLRPASSLVVTGSSTTTTTTTTTTTVAPPPLSSSTSPQPPSTFHTTTYPTSPANSLPNAQASSSGNTLKNHDRSTVEVVDPPIGASYNKNLIGCLNTSSFRHMCHSFGLRLTLLDPTRVAASGRASCIDNIITNIAPDLCESRMSSMIFSDHTAQECDIILPAANAILQKTGLGFARALYPRNLRRLSEWLRSYSWLNVYSLPSINGQAVEFFGVLLTAADSFCPWVPRKAKKTAKKIRNFSVALAPHKERVMFFLEKSRESPEDEGIADSLRGARREYRRQTKFIVVTSNDDIISTAHNRCKAAWRVVRQEAGHALLRSAQALPSCDLTASGFSEYFASSVTTLLESMGSFTGRESTTKLEIRFSEALCFLRLRRRPDCVFSLREVSVEQVFAAMLRLKNSRAVDVCGFDSGFIKAVAPFLVEQLTHLINMCFRTGYLPDFWKASVVTPVHKKGQTDRYDHFRPVSIISYFLKVIELVIYEQLQDYFEANNILDDSQFGFRRRRNTTQAVTELVSGCLEGLDRCETVGALLFDMSKAFDLVNLSLLLLKLRYYGFDETALAFFENYLFEWKQCVSFNGEYSDLRDLPSGVRQGSILGPLLFIVFTNDLPELMTHRVATAGNVNVKMIMYADDLTALVRAPSSDLYEESVRLVKSYISLWCSANYLVLNESKTQALTFSPRGSDSFAVTLLGLRLDEAVSWKPHICALRKSLGKLVFLLRRLSFAVSHGILLNAYYGLFESRLRYGVLLWGSSTGALAIFRLQKAAVRTLDGAPSDAHCRPIFKKLRLLTLPGLYALVSLVRIRNNIQEFPRLGDHHTYQTRNRDDLSINRHRLTLVQKRSPDFVGDQDFQPPSSKD